MGGKNNPDNNNKLHEIKTFENIKLRSKHLAA
jgi:hypothetical protein